MQCFYTIFFDNAHYCYWKKRWLVWYRQTDKCHIFRLPINFLIWDVSKTRRKKRKKKTKSGEGHDTPCDTKCRSPDTHKVGVGLLKLKVLYWRCFFFERKNKKKERKKAVRRHAWFPTRATKRQVSVGRQHICRICCITPGRPLFFSNFELPPPATAILSGRSYVKAIWFT